MEAITSSQVITFLYILVALMIIVVLYHVLFIVADLRRIARRFELITQQVEDVIMKPLSVADQIFQAVIDYAKKHKNRHRD